jgi:DNA-binding LacI/PurR family transcriptional regulator
LTQGRVRAARRARGVGFDDIADTRFLRPSLSTVSQPLDRLGRLAYEIVCRAPGTVAAAHGPTAFVARDSCGCPPKGLAPTEELHRPSSRTTSTCR